MNDAFLQIVKKTIKNVEPDARIVFFGSRCRGSAAENADWDFLILLDSVIDEKRKDRIRYALFNVELEHNQVINSIIVGHDQWNSAKYRVIPLHKNIEREGIPL